MLDPDVLGAWTAASFRSGTPLLLVMLGETLTQRSGVINLGVEGEMLVGACFGFAVAVGTGSAALGLAAGAAAGSVLAALHAVLVLGARANQLGSGLAVWMIGLGTTSYVGRTFVGQHVAPLPALDQMFGALPGVLHPLGQQLTPTAPAAVLLAIAAGLWLARTRPGLAWRTVGESADVARALGLHPTRIRTFAILLGGALAGVGGAVLSVDYTQTWAQDMTNGTGFVAVGLVIVARWSPFLVVPLSLLFGLASTAVLRSQAAGLAISPSLLATTPYLLSVGFIVVAQIVGRTKGAMPADLKAIFKTA